MARAGTCANLSGCVARRSAVCGASETSGLAALDALECRRSISRLFRIPRRADVARDTENRIVRSVVMLKEGLHILDVRGVQIPESP